MSTDIDIDFAERQKAAESLSCVPAVLVKHGKRTPHQTGVYFQDVPVDPIDGLAVWEDAEAKGFFTVDFLTNKIYRSVRDEAHLIYLLQREPPWEAFLDREIVSGLYHISEHFDVLEKIKPRSIEDLAVCLALIRPRKRYLKRETRSVIDRDIWLKKDTERGFFFKRAHAISYAAAIVVQLNSLVEQVNG